MKTTMHPPSEATPEHPSSTGFANITGTESARFASIIESSEDAIVSKDLTGKILTWNRGAAAIYGYTAEEAVGRSINLLVPPERIDEEQSILSRIRDGERVQHFETVRIKKNGTPIHVSLTISPIREGQSVVGASHVARDISERRRLEVDKAQLAAIVESSEDAIISTDLSGLILTWNESAERVYGYSIEEACGRKMNFLLPPGLEREDDQILDQVSRGQRVEHFETTRVRKDATTIQLSLTISPIRDRTGSVVGASHVARELTERRRLEAANAQLAAIVEFSEDAIVSKDLNGTIQTWNYGAERLYGYSAEEAIGHNIGFLLPPDRLTEEQEILARLRRGERVQHFEASRLRKDGRVIDVSLSISPIRDARGVITGASHIGRDITEQKQFEQQMQQTQRLESLGVLAGGIAHDFNNLLTGIIGNASLMSETLPVLDPNRRFLDDMTLAAERAADLTRQLLAYSGRGQFVVGPVNVSELVSEISTLVNASIPKSVALRLELDKGIPPIKADRSQIQQLVMNLIINAAESVGEHRPGTVLVKTGTQQLDEQAIRVAFPAVELRPGNYIYLEVRDDGSGMSPEILARIFDPFFTTKFTGRGLGLAAATGIVKAHHGAICVHSTPGRGSTFKVFFPVAEGISEADSDGGKTTILVVDDEEFVRKVAQSTLQNEGYRVLLAADGKEAVELFRRKSASIALVILDLTMPVMGGNEALRQMRAINPEAVIVLSSGYGEAEATKRFGNESLDGFIQKPYTSARLRERVKAVLARPANGQTA